MSLYLARRGRSRWCNNFGSYLGYKRRGERVGSGTAFDPKEKSITLTLCIAVAV